MKHPGFTFIELLLTIVIFVIIVSFLLFLFPQAVSRINLLSEAQQMIGVLREAQAHSFSGKVPESGVATPWGVYFIPKPTNQYFLFAASSCSPLPTTINSYTLRQSFTIENVTFGGNSCVIFQRITGIPVSTGQVTLADPAFEQRTLTVESTGNISYQ